MYYGGARAEYYLTQERHLPEAPRGSMYIERRTLGNSNHCSSCIEWKAKGWQRLGALPAPTKECICGNNCRCDKDRILIPVGDEENWIGTQRAGG